jgi:hypothetical protein
MRSLGEMLAQLAKQQGQSGGMLQQRLSTSSKQLTAMSSTRPISTFSRQSMGLPPKLPKEPGSSEQWVKVHYWQPGYTLTPPLGGSLRDPKDPTRVITKATFIPLNTAEAGALVAKQRIKMDPTISRISIGHVAMETPNEYLSIGFRGTLARILKLDTNKPATLSSREELIGWPPHSTATFKSLNVTEVDAYIKQYRSNVDSETGISSDKKYNVTGSEISSSDNCTTSVYRGLLAGGAQTFLNPKISAIMRTMPTAAWLFEYAKEGEKTESTLIKQLEETKKQEEASKPKQIAENKEAKDPQDKPNNKNRLS